MTAPRRLRSMPMLALMASSTAAQISSARNDPFQPARGIGARSNLRLIDQGVADLGPQNSSLRSVGSRVELRQDTGWERLYRDDKTGAYYRFNGAVGASFPRSSYVQNRDGTFPEIPPGTVFHVGGDHLSAARGGARGPVGVMAEAPEEGRLSSRVSNYVAAEAAEGEPILRGSLPARGALAREEAVEERSRSADRARAVETPTMATNEAYRRKRMAELLRDAARADRR